MKKTWCILFLCILIYQCNNSYSKSSNPYSLVPEDTEILIKINATESFKNSTKNNAFLNALSTYPDIENISKTVAPFQNITKDNSFIALSKNNHNQVNVSIIIPSLSEKMAIDSFPEIRIDSVFSLKENINKLIIEDSIFYSTSIDSILFISNRIDQVKKALNTTSSIDENLKKIYSTSDNEKMTSVFINHKKEQSNAMVFEDSVLNQLKFSDYTLVDGDISQNTILINGITKSADSSKSLINIFKNTVPQENRLASILPSDIDYFKSMTVDNYTAFIKNMITHGLQDSITETQDKLQNMVEFGQATLGSSNAIFLRSIDPSTAFDNFSETMTSVDEYRTSTIFKVNDYNSTQLQKFSPLINASEIEYASFINDFIVFSNELSFLQHIISSYHNNSVLAKTDTYKNLELHLSDEASILQYRNASKINSKLNYIFTDDIKLNIPDHTSSAIQYIYDTNFAHVNGVFKTNKTEKSQNTVSEDLNIALDADIIVAPQLVKNHTNGQKDIIIQDINNNLYLISNQGKVFWKKQLDGKILGKVKQIDTYKNGRLQLVFNTSKQLYVLDRKGNNVSPFPLKFNDNITQPVSVFDYDKKKNYRLLIAQGKSLLMYDKKGKIVSGFTYKNAENNISSQPKHFRIGRKDFIAFTHGNRMEILNRVGKTRVNVKENINFSGNDIYLYKNRFTTSNTNGELIEINQSGNVNHKNLNANSDHKIATTSKTLVVLNDNKLTIKSKTIDLDFGEYTAPNIFYINDKIYVTVTDLQSKKGYLFDSQAKPIANFPVYANSELRLANIDKDNNLEVITKGDNDAIIIYEIH